jgi:hypothetical protein
LGKSLGDAGDFGDLSQSFNDTPDLDPITVGIISDCSEDQSRAVDFGYLVSRYISPKTFLNIFSQQLGFIPTKSRVFMQLPESSESSSEVMTVRELRT